MGRLRIKRAFGGENHGKLGIGLIDKESGRISGTESLLYPTLSETSEGDIYMEFASMSHKLPMRH